MTMQSLGKLHNYLPQWRATGGWIYLKRRVCARAEDIVKSFNLCRTGHRAPLSQKGQWKHYKISHHPQLSAGGIRASSTPIGPDARLNRQDPVPDTKMMALWDPLRALPTQDPRQAQVLTVRFLWTSEPRPIPLNHKSHPYHIHQSSVRQMSSLSKPHPPSEVQGLLPLLLPNNNLLPTSAVLLFNQAAKSSLGARLFRLAR
jgi:hypothetical protein